MISVSGTLPSIGFAAVVTALFFVLREFLILKKVIRGFTKADTATKDLCIDGIAFLCHRHLGSPYEAKTLSLKALDDGRIAMELENDLSDEMVEKKLTVIVSKEALLQALSKARAA